MVDITKIAAIYADAEHYSGMTVTVGGWVKTIRDLKTVGFIELNDGSCFRNLQVVMDANILANYKEIAAQNVGAALKRLLAEYAARSRGIKKKEDKTA